MNSSKYSLTLILLKVVIFFHCQILCSNSFGLGESNEKISKRIAPPRVPIATSTLAPTDPTTQSSGSPRTITPSLIQTGIGCGTRYMRPREIVRIQSNNFNWTTQTLYQPNDACTWRFIGNDCTISAECPCFDIPASFDCIEDYFKIIDLPYYTQKFCGISKPNGPYWASTEKFSIRFRSNRRTAGKGFVCFVQCVALGDPVQNTPSSNDLHCSSN